MIGLYVTYTMLYMYVRKKPHIMEGIIMYMCVYWAMSVHMVQFDMHTYMAYFTERGIIIV